ncbi:MAG: TetR/AcrR family transcriptional regulator [Erythrobacter sp.]
MASSETVRQKLLPLMATHILENGMGSASLRPLAKAAGTSDRMLIYHFGNKQQLITDVLAYIADSYSAQLETFFGSDRVASREQAIARVRAFTNSGEMRPFLALWWEIVAGAARDVPGYRENAQAIMVSLLSWFEGQMPEGDPDPAGGARTLLTLIEGAEMFNAIGLPDIPNRGIEAGRPF